MRYCRFWAQACGAGPTTEDEQGTGAPEGLAAEVGARCLVEESGGMLVVDEGMLS